MEAIIETPRLLVRKLTVDDHAFILKLLNTKEWLQNIGNRNIHGEAEARKYLQDVPLKSYAENGFGIYLVLLKNNRIPIGVCGLIKREGLPGIDIGFALIPEFFGRGYAYESAAAVLHYARSVLRITTLYAIVLPANLPSIRLLGKLGFLFVNKITLVQDGEQLQLYKHTG